MYKVDLHTHSTASPDGGISLKQYLYSLQDEKLDCIAITDHNTIDTALELNETLGERVIVGEEIMSKEGEIIGLFLSDFIEPGQSAIETVRAIKAQKGIVYIPHPFETMRKGLLSESLQKIADFVDIVEVHNGRAWAQNRGPQAVTWATLHRKARASSSDAHGVKGLGHCYNLVDEIPSRHNLISLLNKHSRLVTGRPPIHSFLYPTLNRTIKKFTPHKKHV